MMKTVSTPVLAALLIVGALTCSCAYGPLTMDLHHAELRVRHYHVGYVQAGFPERNQRQQTHLVVAFDSDVEMDMQESGSIYFSLYMLAVKDGELVIEDYGSISEVRNSGEPDPYCLVEERDIGKYRCLVRFDPSYSRHWDIDDLRDVDSIQLSLRCIEPFVPFSENFSVVAHLNRAQIETLLQNGRVELR